MKNQFQISFTKNLSLLSILFVFLNLFSMLPTFSQDFGWAKSMGSTSPDEGMGVVVDATGNVYSTGWFEGTVDFNPGEGTLSLTSNGLADIYLQKLNASGELIWAHHIGGENIDRGYSIDKDSEGNIYLTGSYIGVVDFDPGPGEAILSSILDFGSPSEDIFFAKFNSDGELVWAKSIGGNLADRGLSIRVNDHHLVLAGYFRGTSDFDPTPEVAHSITSKGGTDAFVAVYNLSGGLDWARGFGGSTGDISHAATFDPDGNVVVGGEFRGTVDFDPGPGDASITSNGAADAFVSSFSSTGTLNWNYGFGGTSTDYVKGLAINDTGAVYAVGSFESIVDFDFGDGEFSLTSTGGKDAFLLKIALDGSFGWAKKFGGVNEDECLAITSDGNGHYFTTGYYSGGADLDPGPGESITSVAGLNDIFVQKLNASGDLVWAATMGGTLFEEGLAIGLDASGNPHITGDFAGTCDFNPGEGSTSLVSSGLKDIFVVKLEEAITGPLALPTFSHPTGTYSEPVMVSILHPTSGVSIYYTTNGNLPRFDVPNGFTKLYTGPISILENTTVRAVATKTGLENSKIAMAILTIENPGIAAKPIISPGTGTVEAATEVSMSTSTPGATIYYTTNGNLPVLGTSFTKAYTTAFTIHTSTTIRAMAVKTGILNSPVSLSVITMTSPTPVVATPIISHPTGSYEGPQAVSLSTTTPGATLFYTTNGMTPRFDVPNSFTKTYTGPFLIASSATVRAVGTLLGHLNSGVTVSYITITPGRKAVAPSEILAGSQAFPNPSMDGRFQVKYNLENEAHFVVNGLDGKVIAQGLWEPGIDHFLDINVHSSGIYFLRITDKLESVPIKLVIQ